MPPSMVHCFGDENDYEGVAVVECLFTHQGGLVQAYRRSVYFAHQTPTHAIMDFVIKLLKCGRARSINLNILKIFQSEC